MAIQKPAEGTPFWVSLRNGKEPKMSQLRILVIDDEAEARWLLQRLLERDGHKVVTASEGWEGVSLFQQALDEGSPFDLVITDWSMPTMHGGRVVQAIRTLSPQTPIILLSGWDSREHLDPAITQIVDSLLVKPSTLQELRLAIRKVLSSRTKSP